MKRKIQTKYQRDFVTTSSLVSEFDLCGLIRGGAPLDEYDCLTTLILSSVYKNKSRSEIKGQIINELLHHFGTYDSIDIPQHQELDLTLDKLLDRIEIQLLV